MKASRKTTPSYRLQSEWVHIFKEIFEVVGDLVVSDFETKIALCSSQANQRRTVLYWTNATIRYGISWLCHTVIQLVSALSAHNCGSCTDSCYPKGDSESS